MQSIAVNNRKTRFQFLPEFAVLAVYMGLLAFIMSRHEPWFDEAQAWLMARDLSYSDLLFKWLRYEGHPPVWYLLLSVPAKLGVPYEWGLKSVEFVCASAAASVLLFKSPFPRPVRLLLPFTYYFFYQYGVISRCYSVMMLFLWLAAVCFPERNARPARFVAMLALLGGTMAYGMLISFGVAVAWFVEMLGGWRGRGFRPTITRMLADKRFRALLVLAAVNMLFVIILLPPADQFAPLAAGHTGLVPALNSVLTAPAEAVFMDIPTMADPAGTSLLWLEIIASAAIVAFFLLVMHRRRSLLYAALTLGLLFLFFLVSYYYIHHSGILLMAFIFLLWISARHELGRRPAPKWLTGLAGHKKDLKPALVAAIAGVLAVQIGWSGFASVNDIRQPYDGGRQLAAFIKENGLEKHEVSDGYLQLAKGAQSFLIPYISMQPYFDRNLFYNVNGGNPGTSFAQHKAVAAGELRRIKSSPSPDFILSSSQDVTTYYRMIPIEKYVKVAEFDYAYFWKTTYLTKSDYSVYIREDLLPAFPQFRALPDPMLDLYKKQKAAGGNDNGQ